VFSAAWTFAARIHRHAFSGGVWLFDVFGFLMSAGSAEPFQEKRERAIV